MQDRKLELMALGGLIDWIVTSEEAGSEKPELRIFEQCIAKSGAAPEECLFVGDSMKHDVTGAAAAGLHTLLFDPAGKYAACEAADHIIRSYAECLEPGFLSTFGGPL